MKKGKINRLNDDRIRKLNAIGFVWVAKKDDKWKELEHERIVSTYDDSWEKMYQVLLKFKKKNGMKRCFCMYHDHIPFLS